MLLIEKCLVILILSIIKYTNNRNEQQLNEIVLEETAFFYARGAKELVESDFNLLDQSCANMVIEVSPANGLLPRLLK
jgi:hypothetical protein